jgi:hypothetical protein
MASGGKSHKCDPASARDKQRFHDIALLLNQAHSNLDLARPTPPIEPVNNPISKR